MDVWPGQAQFCGLTSLRPAQCGVDAKQSVEMRLLYSLECIDGRKVPTYLLIQQYVVLPE